MNKEIKSKEAKVYNSCGHNLISYNLSYVAHSEEGERRLKKGMRQKQCPACGLWLFKDELSTNPKNINRLP